MSLYPTLEDMKVGELIKAQVPPTQASTTAETGAITGLYPSLSSYMGFDLATISHIGHAESALVAPAVIAPISQQNALGIKRAEIRPGMRKITLCKNSQGHVGLTIRDINKGIFAGVVHADSPASLAGMRFGDQILEINDQILAGYSADKARKLIRKCSPEKIEIVIRDRPFERTITLNKDSHGYVGFGFKNGEISLLAKDSSAARNGLLTEHQLIEVDGRCVVGMSDKQILSIIEMAPRTLTVTIMPSVLFKHMVKCIGSSELKKFQDHSVPEI